MGGRQSSVATDVDADEEPVSVEDKWKANQEKVAFMKRFPGLLSTWDQLCGKVLEKAIPLKTRSGTVLVFSDKTFIIAPSLTLDPSELKDALGVARPVLESAHTRAYAEYDRLVERDQAASREARLEKIVGAIENNVEQIPELKDHVRSLVEKWTREGTSS